MDRDIKGQNLAESGEGRREKDTYGLRIFEFLCRWMRRRRVESMTDRNVGGFSLSGVDHISRGSWSGSGGCC